MSSVKRECHWCAYAVCVGGGKEEDSDTLTGLEASDCDYGFGRRPSTFPKI